MWKPSRSRYGPDRFIASPPIRLSKYMDRTLSGMIMAANTVITPVQITAYQHTRLAVMRRFLSLG